MQTTRTNTRTNSTTTNTTDSVGGAGTLLLWDLASINAAVDRLVDGRPGRDQRPDMAAVARWAKATYGVDTVDAWVCVAVTRASFASVKPFLETLVKLGYHLVIHKSVQRPTNLTHLVERTLAAERDDYANVVVASHDTAGLASTLTSLAVSHTVTALGLRPHAPWPRGVDYTPIPAIADAIADPAYTTRAA